MEPFHQLICPHCHGMVIVMYHELNCRIFRHGIYLANGQPIPPHASESECAQLVANHLIAGCGKPFQVIQQDGLEVAVECGYI